MTKDDGWQDTLDDLDRRRRHAWGMGGPERLARHREDGKLDARARVERLLDKATFSEFGTLVGGQAAADGIYVVGCDAHDQNPLQNGRPFIVRLQNYPRGLCLK